MGTVNEDVMWKWLKIGVLFFIGWDVLRSGGGFGEMLATQMLISIMFMVMDYGMMQK